MRRESATPPFIVAITAFNHTAILRSRRSCRTIAFVGLVLLATPLPLIAQGALDIVWQRGGHAGSHDSVAYSPDGTRLATAGGDGSIKILRVSDGMLLRTIRSDRFTLGPAAWTPDSQSVVASAWRLNTVINVYRASDGALTRTISLPGEQGTVPVAVSPDGLLVAAGSLSAGAKIFRLADGVLVQQLAANYGQVVQFSPDGQYLGVAASSPERTVLLRVSNWTIIKEFDSVVARAIAFSPDSTQIAVGNSDGVIVFNVSTFARVWNTFGFATRSIVYSPDGAYLAAGDYAITGPTIANGQLLRTSDGMIVRSFPATRPSCPAFVSFAPNSQTLAIGCWDLKLWRVSDGSLAQTISHHYSFMNSVAAFPDGQTVAVGTYDIRSPNSEQSVSYWRASDGAFLRRFEIADGRILGIAISPNGSVLATNMNTGGPYAAPGVVQLWDTATDRLLRTTSVGATKMVEGGLRFFPDGQSVVVLSRTEGDLQIVNEAVVIGVSDGVVRRRLQTPRHISAIAIAPDGSRVYLASSMTGVGGEQMVIYVFDGAATTPSRTILGPFVASAQPRVAEISPDGSLLAVAGVGPDLASVGGNFDHGGSLFVWRTSDSVLQAHTMFRSSNYSTIRAMAFSSDGATLVLGGDDGLRTFQTTTWAQQQFYDEEVGGDPGQVSKILSVAAIPGTTRFVYGRVDASLGVANIPATPTCNLTLSPQRASVSAGGGSGTFAIGVTASTCAWTAVSDAAWLTVTNAASGTGNATVSYTAAALATSSARVGHIAIGSQRVTIVQSPSSCSYALSATTRAVGLLGAVATVDVSTQAGCRWTAWTAASWVAITDQLQGTIDLDDTFEGNRTLQFLVFPNPTGAARSADLTIAGRTLTVSSTCTNTLSPTSANLAAGGGTGTVSVTTEAAQCSWTAATNAAFITVTAGAAGTGAGSVSYSVVANTATGTRTGTLTIAGQTFTVSQAGASCGYTLSPETGTAPAPGGSGAVSLTTAADCTWTAASDSSWLTVTPSSGTGSASLQVTAAANNGTSSRTGVVTVGGRTFTLTQAGLTCSYSVSPASANAPASGGAGALAITTTTGCSWTAVSDSAWLTLSPGSGAGSGSVTWTAAANAGAASRAAQLLVAGQGVVITQAGLGVSGAPRDLAADVAGSRLTLTWRAPEAGPAPSQYRIEVGSATGLTNVASVPTPNATPSFVADPAPPGTFYIRVRAVTSEGTGPASNEVTAVVQAPSVPGAPSQLVATVTGNLLMMTWSAPVTGGAPTGYVIEAGTVPASGSTWQIPTGTTATTFTFSGVPNGQYFARVRGSNAVGTGPASNDATFRVGPAACTAAPAAPIGLQAEAVGGVVSLTWVAGTGGSPPTGYQIEAGLTPGGVLVRLDWGSTVTQYSASAPPGTYFVRVRAINGCGTSVPSADVTVTIAP